MPARRPAALLLVLAVGAVSAGAAVVGMVWGFGFKCDDTCSTPPPWRNDPDAWQWSALGWAGIGTLALALLVLGALVARRRALASVAAVVWLAAAAAYIVLFDDSGLTSNVERGWVGLLLLTVALGAAIALTPPLGDQSRASRS